MKWILSLLGRRQIDRDLDEEIASHIEERVDDFDGLVASGLYGTLAYNVSRRTGEVGVRMALGPHRVQILWTVLRRSLAVSLTGILIGLPLAIAGTRFLRSMLFGVTPGDPRVLALAVFGIILVAILSSLIPARSAASVDPVVALRFE
jgi:ABC-type antimicrobial peptide transport system permease subunit